MYIHACICRYISINYTLTGFCGRSRRELLRSKPTSIVANTMPAQHHTPFISNTMPVQHHTP